MIFEIFLIQLFIYIIDFTVCENLAYKKPAFQSSSYSRSYVAFTADLAVDGKLGRSINNGDCSHTSQKDDTDWFVLDLQEKYFIDYVSVSGRDELYERLNYFIVGLSNSFNFSSPPVRGSYELCGQYTLKSVKNDIMTVNCFYQNIAAQYIIIQPPIGGPGEITICNLEVYGKKYRKATYIGCYLKVTTLSQHIVKDNANIDLLSLCVETCRLAFTTYATIKNDICRCANEVQNSLPSYKCYSPERINQAFAIYTSCPLGLFGANCEYVCHCTENIQCNILDGTCPNNCANNWSGPSCNITFPTYLGCEYDLHQSHFTYIRETSAADLLTNELCSNVCFKDKFLYSASKNSKCFCGNEINFDNIYERGNCTYPCPGNKSQNCGSNNYRSISAVCPFNFFGYKCQYECHCKDNAICSNINGNCSNGCANGWTGSGCHISNCSYKNGNCGPNEICQFFNNSFICECRDGFFKANEYRNCIEIKKIWPLIVGLILGMFILSFVLALFKYQIRKRKKKNNLNKIEIDMISNCLNEDYELKKFADNKNENQYELI